MGAQGSERRLRALPADRPLRFCADGRFCDQVLGAIMNSTTTFSWRVLLAVITSALLCGAPRAAAAAQPPPTASPRTGTDTRWQPWLGCWSATPPRFVDLEAPPQQVCIVPAAGASAVDVVTVSGSTIVSRERIDANGEHRPSERDGCTGWESAEWSADMRRVYLLSEVTCT